MGDSSQTERQMYILSLLSENKRGFTIEDIISSLERVDIYVSKKTVERDLDSISMNFFVYDEEKDNKTYYYAKKFNLDNITFTGMELISLYFNREMLNAYSNLDVGKAAYGLLDRIIKQMPDISKAYMDTLKDTFKIENAAAFQNKEKDLNQEHLNLIREASSLGRNLSIEYHSFNEDKTTSREISPYLIEIRGGCYHVIGYCHLRNENRDFRISRIKQVKLLDTKFERPADFYKSYSKDRFDKLAGNASIELKLRFTDEAARYVMEYESERADHLQLDGDVLIFERSATLTPDIFKWILGFGDQVQVLEPAVVREEVIRRASGILKNYNKE